MELLKSCSLHDDAPTSRVPQQQLLFEILSIYKHSFFLFDCLIDNGDGDCNCNVIDEGDG